jgi:tetratricopeptide (TPR) repeat protein
MSCTFNKQKPRLLGAAAAAVVATLAGCADPVQSRFETGQSAAAADRSEEAIRAFKEVAIGYPNHELAAQAWVEVAQLYYRDHRDVFLARQAAERVLRDYPNREQQRWRAEELLAQIFDADLGNPERAVYYYEKLLENGASPKKRGEYSYRMGECYYLMREFPLALKAFGAVAENPRLGELRIQARMRIARIHMLMGETAEALESYRLALELHPPPAIRELALVGRADALEALGRYQEALQVVAELPEPERQSARRLRLEEKARNRNHPTVEWAKAADS